MQSTHTQALEMLLIRAGSAHGAYEARELGGVYDQDWPQWYAAYLLEHGLTDLLASMPIHAQVAAWLQACDTAYRAERPAMPWPAFYAARIGAL